MDYVEVKQVLDQSKDDLSLSHTVVYKKKEYKPVGGSGWLNFFTQEKNGRIYPRIIGSEHERGAPEDYPHHYYWRYCWLDSGKRRSRIVNHRKLQSVRYAIASRKPVKEILRLLS